MGAKLHKRDVLKRFNKTHNSKFYYPDFYYSGMSQTISIVCPKHGLFTQKIGDHMAGCGCKKCSGKYQYSPKEYIEEVKLTHGDKYTYENTVYVNTRTAIEINCPTHGPWKMNPNDFRRGHGCSKCGNFLKGKSANNYHNRPTILYYICIEGIHYKIGITMKGRFTDLERAIRSRYSLDINNGVKIDIIKYELFEDGSEAYALEEKIIEANSSLRIQKSEMITDTGYTETFKTDIRRRE